MKHFFSFHELAQQFKIMEKETDVRFDIRSDHDVFLHYDEYRPRYLHFQSEMDCGEQEGNTEILWDLLNGYLHPVSLEEIPDSDWGGDGYDPQDIRTVLHYLQQTGVLLMRKGRISIFQQEVLATYYFSRCYFEVKEQRLICVREEEAWQEKVRFDFSTHEVTQSSIEASSFRVVRQAKDVRFLKHSERGCVSRMEWLRFVDSTVMEQVLYETIWQFYFYLIPELGTRKVKKWYEYLSFPTSIFENNALLNTNHWIELEDSSMESLEAHAPLFRKIMSIKFIEFEQVLDLFYTRCYQVKSYEKEDLSYFLQTPQAILSGHGLPVAKTTVRLLLEAWENLSLIQTFLRLGFSVKEMELLTKPDTDYVKLQHILTYPWVQRYIQTLGTKGFARMIYRHKGCPFSTMEDIHRMFKQLKNCLPLLEDETTMEQVLNFRLNLHHFEQEFLRLFEVYHHHPMLTNVFDISRVKQVIPFKDCQVQLSTDWCFKVMNHSKLLDYFLRKYKLCLPSYLDRLEHQKVALIGIYHQDVFKGCMELNLESDIFQVVQLKQPFNKAPNEELKEMAQLFATSFGLEVKRLA